MNFKDINEILDFAIEAEQEAFEFYTSMAAGATSSEMKKVFEQFAKEEVGHKAKLLDVKKTGIFESSDKKVTDLKISDYMVNVIPYPGMSYQEALVVAMTKEKAAFRLYTDLADIAESAELKEIFLMLAMEESKHKLRFELEYDENVLREN